MLSAETPAGEPRAYRSAMVPVGLIRTDVAIGESDLTIFARRDVRRTATASLARCRRAIETYIQLDPAFRTALRPVLPLPGAPPIVRRMIEAGAAVGVGPMAAVAGAIAEDVGRDLLATSDEVIVENGGDIFIARAGHGSLPCGREAPPSTSGLRSKSGHPTARSPCAPRLESSGTR